MSTPHERISALLAAGRLTTAQQVAAVDKGWLTVEQVSVAARAQAANLTTVRADLRATLAAIDALIGTAADPAGTGTLRAIKATPNATINSGSAPYVKALADAVIALARAVKKDIRLDVRSLDATD